MGIASQLNSIVRLRRRIIHSKNITIDDINAAKESYHYSIQAFVDITNGRQIFDGIVDYLELEKVNNDFILRVPLKNIKMTGIEFFEFNSISFTLSC